MSLSPSSNALSPARLDLPFLSRFRAARTGFVLLFGNEGVLLARYNGGVLESWRLVDSVGPDAISSVASEIAKHPSWPVLVLNDVAEQAYRREMVPRINPFERNRLLRQRLDYAFPGSELKAAAAMPGRKRRAREDEYMLVALTPSAEAQAWRDALEQLPNTLDVALLPVETAAMVAALAETGAGIKSGWTLYIARHRTGGLRQIVIRDGTLLLTRLSPISHGLSPADLAHEIRSDLDTTLAYLTRFGFTAARGLNLIVIGPEALETALRATELPVDRLDVFDAAAAGGALGLSHVVMPDPMDGDLLSLAYAAARPRPLLSVLPAAWRARSRSQGRRQAAVLAPAVLALALMAGVGAIGWNMVTLQGEADQLAAARLVSDTEIVKQRQRIATLPLSPTDIIRGHSLIDRLDRAPDPLATAARLRLRLADVAPITRIIWQPDEKPTNQADSAAEDNPDAPPPPHWLKVTLDLSNTPDPAAATAVLERAIKLLTPDWPSATVLEDPVLLHIDESFSGAALRDKPPEWQRRRHMAVIGVSLDPPAAKEPEAKP